jgi:hypothetical protein
VPSRAIIADFLLIKQEFRLFQWHLKERYKSQHAIQSSGRRSRGRSAGRRSRRSCGIVNIIIIRSKKIFKNVSEFFVFICANERSSDIIIFKDVSESFSFFFNNCAASFVNIFNSDLIALVDCRLVFYFEGFR